MAGASRPCFPARSSAGCPSLISCNFPRPARVTPEANPGFGLLPYAFGNFDYIDLGPLSTLLFSFSVGYAIARHQLLDIRVLLRKTLAPGIAPSLVLAAYSALALLATDKFATSEPGGATRLGVLVLAFSFDPVRRFLESRIDKLLFPDKRKGPRG